MTKRFKWVILSAALLASTVGATDPPPPPAELPVLEMKPVAPAEYSAASALAARGSAPLEIVLTIVGEFEGSTQHIIQVNEGSEAPSATLCHLYLEQHHRRPVDQFFMNFQLAFKTI